MDSGVMGESSVDGALLPAGSVVTLPIIASDPTSSSIDGCTTATIINVPILRDGTLLNTCSAIPTSQGLVFTTGPDGTSAVFLDPSQVAVFTQADPSTVNFVPIENANLGESGVEPTIDNNEVQATEVQGSERQSVALDLVEILPPIGKGPFVCTTCSKEFPKWNQLQRHMRTHIDDKPHRCDKCSQSFNVESNLVLHHATHNVDNPTCPECHKRFSRIASLKAHIMLHEKEESVMCDECGEEFGTQSQLTRHLRVHRIEEAEKTMYFCKKCDFQFSKPALLREHMRAHYRIKASLSHRIYKRNIDRSSFNHKCVTCGKTFQKPSQLERHVRIHTGERPYVCKQCGKAFNQKGALQIHITKHSGERPYRCDFCPAAFSQRGNLRAHIQRVHMIGKEGNQTLYCCEECTCVFKKLGSLNAHMSRMHADDSAAVENKTDTNQATVDGKAVKNVIKQIMDLSGSTPIDGSVKKEVLNQDSTHVEAEDILGSNSDILQQALQNSGLTSSAGLRNANSSLHGDQAGNLGIASVRGLHSTQTMSYADSVTGTLKKHMIRKIGGIRWHQCLYCAKEFKKPSDLVRHIRIHTHEKPYKCVQCFRAFTVKSTLTAHVRTHTGVKEFACAVCDKLFSTQGSLKVHLRLHTGSKPFDCPHCDKRFRTSGHRKSHMVSHQKDGEPKKARKPVRRPPRSTVTLPEVPLPEPILITDNGLVQSVPLFTQLPGENAGPDRPYKCVCCSRAFKKSSHLKQHIRSHTGEKPFRCLQCMRCFVSGGVLKAHMRTHTGLKSYHCMVCDNSFTTNGSLKRHMSIHSELRPFMCPYCQKTFKTSVNCKKHMKTHKLELAFQASQNLNMDNTPAVMTTVLTPQICLEETVGEPQTVIEVESTNRELVEPSDASTTLAPQGITLTQLFSEQNPLSEPDIGQKSLQNTSCTTFDQPTFSQSTFEQLTDTAFTMTSDQLQSTLDISGLDESFNPGPPVLESTNISNILQTQETACQTLSDDQDGSTVAADASHDSDEKWDRRNYKCSYCRKCFKKSSHLKQHERTHTGEKPYKCTQCNRMFVSTGVLKAHQRTHTGAKDYQCHMCQAWFTTNGSLTRHKMIHSRIHSAAEGKSMRLRNLVRTTVSAASRQTFKCSCCEASFQTAVDLKSHVCFSSESVVTSTTPERNSVTEESKKARSTFVQLSEELTYKLAKQKPEEGSSISEKILIASAAEKDRVSEIKDKHSELQRLPKFPHMCQMCPKSFKKPSDLVRHTRIHTGEKPFKCDLCNKCFTVKSTLDSHLKTHSGEKHFTCHVCNSLFATKGSLKVHMRLHTGAKPFKCPHCEQRFRTSGHRKSHIMTHFKLPQQIKRRRPPGIRNEQLQHLNIDSVILEQKVDIGVDDSTAEQDATESLLSSAGYSNNTDVLQAVGLMPGQPSASQQDNIMANITLSLDGLQADAGGSNSEVLDAAGTTGLQIAGIESGSVITQTIQIDAALLQQLQEQGNINITLGNLVAPSNDDTTLPTTTTAVTAAGSNLILQPLNITFPVGTHSQVLVPVDDQTSAFQLSLAPTLSTSGADVVSTPMELPSDTNTDKDGTTEVNLNITESGEMVTQVQIHSADCSSPPMTSTTARPAPAQLLPHVCGICAKCFAKPSQLERHVRIHTGERPFQCSQCPKAFNQKNALQVHLSRHTGERPFKCSLCTLAFSQKGNLNVHLRRVHNCGKDVTLVKAFSTASSTNAGGDCSIRVLSVEECVGSIVTANNGTATDVLSVTGDVGHESDNAISSTVTNRDEIGLTNEIFDR